MKIQPACGLIIFALATSLASAVPTTQPAAASVASDLAIAADVCTGATTAPSAASNVPTTQASPADITALIKQLGDDDFHIRREAGKKLVAIGKPAVPALKNARQSKDLEIQARADELLQEIEEPLVVAEAVPQPLAMGGAHSMSMSITNGFKTVDVHETGRTIHIEESAAGIVMQVTGQLDGKQVTRDFKAPDAQKLAKQNPQAFALYRQYSGNAGNGIAGLRIIGGNGIALNNLNIRMNVNAGGNAMGGPPNPNGELGVSVVKAAAPADGVVVVHVHPGTRAETIGVKPQDILQKLNDDAIHAPSDLEAALRKNPERVTLEIVRDGKPLKLTQERNKDAVELKKP